jgi:outer membrane lipoprotein carrier protein
VGCAFLLGSCFLPLCSAAAAIPADQLTETVLGIQRRYAPVDSVSADFQQIYRAPGIDQVESGRLLMKKPGLMRWEYTSPETKLFIADGRDTWLFAPEDRQVTVHSFTSADLRNTPLRFLLGQGDILASFASSWEKEFVPKFSGTRLVRLLPRTGEQEYQFIVVECDSKNFELRRILLREATGNTSEFVFSNMVMNVKTTRSQFIFKPPKGVEIIRLDEK